MYRSLAAVALVAVLLTASGCGGSKADRAAQDLLDIATEMKEIESSGKEPDMEQGMAMLGRMMEAAKTLEEEVEKMSPEEKKAFEAKWEKRFKDAGLDESPVD